MIERFQEFARGQESERHLSRMSNWLGGVADRDYAMDAELRTKLRLPAHGEVVRSRVQFQVKVREHLPTQMVQ